MPGVVMDSPEMTAIWLLIGGSAALAALGRPACRAIRNREFAVVREAIAGAALVMLAASFALHHHQPRRLCLPASSASGPALGAAPKGERMPRREFIRRAESRAAERRQRQQREDDERRLRECQERERLLARILADDGRWFSDDAALASH